MLYDVGDAFKPGNPHRFESFQPALFSTVFNLRVSKRWRARFHQFQFYLDVVGCLFPSKMVDIPPINCSHTYLLLSIAFSHYVEKARWAFAYYQVPYAQHLLLPALHIFTVKPIVDSNVCTHEKRDTRASPWSTPCLVVYDASGSKLQESFHDSHDILMYLSENFSSPDHVNLYTSCGLAKADEIKALERRYDEGLGVAAIDFFYLDAVVFNKWRSMLPFALMGFKNKVGPLQSLIWFVFSPLIGKMILSAMSITASKYQKAMHTCREEFRHASECKSSPNQNLRENL